MIQRCFNNLRRRISGGRLVAVIGALVACGALAPLATAGLVSYDVKVTGFMSPNNGTNVEQYAATNIDPEAGSNSSLGANVPNTISPTPTPNPFTSAASRVIRSATPLDFDTNNESNREIWLKGPLSDAANIFVNTLDLTKLVEVELMLRFDNLANDQQIVLKNVSLPDSGGGLAEPITVLSGFGSVAEPLHLLMKFTAADVNGGGTQIKIQFDYMTMDRPEVPEPATLALVGLAGLALAGLVRRRSK